MVHRRPDQSPRRHCRVYLGGRAIHTGLVAAPGLFLEFTNGVRTTRIQHAWLIPGGASQVQ